jgi:hypothetical protein
MEQACRHDEALICPSPWHGPKQANENGRQEARMEFQDRIRQSGARAK